MLHQNYKYRNIITIDTQLEVHQPQEFSPITRLNQHKKVNRNALILIIKYSIYIKGKVHTCTDRLNVVDQKKMKPHSSSHPRKKNCISHLVDKYLSIGSSDSLPSIFKTDRRLDTIKSFCKIIRGSVCTRGKISS